MMCYDMRRFEKIAEEKKRHKKKQELSFTLEEKPEILVKARSKGNKLQKG